jgi:hypothetical protein
MARDLGANLSTCLNKPRGYHSYIHPVRPLPRQQSKVAEFSLPPTGAYYCLQTSAVKII